MKTLIFSFLSVLIIPFTLAQEAPESVCQETLREHMEIIASSDDYFKSLKDHSATLKSNEIVLLQKQLTKRYKNLKELLSSYEGEVPQCAPKALSSAVAIYDFSTVRELIVSDTYLRRAVQGMTKFEGFALERFLKDYTKYNSNEFINQTLSDIASSSVSLPDALKDIHPYQLDYDPNMYSIGDAAIKGTTTLFSGLARVWGFISDHMKWRQGRLKDLNEAHGLLLSNLKPLDLIYEKRAYVLSDYTIPGHWGHVGVWLGSKEELIALGVWDQEFFAPFREQVEAGNQIVEVRKTGLGYQSLQSFLNLDEIAVSRIKNIEGRAVTVYKELASQIGKKYDFKFDSRTSDKITCAEFVTFSYGDIKWHETKTLFQRSLRPDDLGLLSVTNPELSEFVVYLKGHKGQNFESLDFNEWKKLFNLRPELSAEEKERIAREKEEKKRLDELYRGGA